MKKSLLMSTLCVLTSAGCKDDPEPGIPTNIDYSGSVSNEICGNDGNANEEGWIEIYNTSNITINLNGVRLVKTDEEDVSEVICTFGEGAAIAGKAYLLRAKGVDSTQGTSDTKSVSIALQTPSGKDIDELDKDAEFGDGGKREVGGSYSRIPDGTGEWTVVLKVTKGTANEITEPEGPPGTDYTGLVLNELNSSKPKYTELYNSTGRELNIIGVKIKKDGGDIVCIASEETKIQSHGLLVPLSDRADCSTSFTSGLSVKKSVKTGLLSPEETAMDVFKNLTDAGEEAWGETSKYDGETEGMAYARKDNGVEWYMMKATQGGSNNTTAGLSTKIEW